MMRPAPVPNPPLARLSAAHPPRPHTPTRLALIALAPFAPAPLFAQASFVEGFDALGPPSSSIPAALVQRGWIFRNQSQPLGSGSFYPGILPSTNPIFFAPQSGAGYLAVDSACTSTTLGGEMSAWAILPPIPGQQQGDLVTIWLRALNASAGMEVRYAPSPSGTGTGSGPHEVGDFTEVLISADPVPSGGWVRYQANVPGPGRIALRYVGTYGGLGNLNPYIGIDTLSVGPPPQPPCNQPAIPAPGQVATWTLAGSPYRICENIAIPAGATVHVEPGVVINFDLGRQLAIAGTLNIHGTAASPVVLSAPGNFPPFITTPGGTLIADAADFQQQLNIGPGATITLRDCNFIGTGTGHGGGMLLTAQNLGGPMPMVSLERCTFSQTFCTIVDALAILRENTFDQTSPWILRGYADITSPNTLIGGRLQITREESIQPLLVDGVIAADINTNAGLALSGGNYLLGPALSFTNNLYTLDLSGGLLPGSTLPQTGNINNIVNVGTGGFAGFGRWIDLGIPYRITAASGDLPGGQLTIDPGITVEFAPDAPFIFRSTRRLIADGLPDAPITFRPAAAGQPWHGLIFQTNSTEGPRLEYCTISGGAFGIVSTDNLLYVENSLLTENALGATAGSFGWTIFGKTRFQGNTIALTNRSQWISRPDRPNIVAGNSIGIDASTITSLDARHVWWGHESGPQHPANPGGQGDPIVGQSAGGVSISPFLTSPPDPSDHPPVVRLLEPGLAWHTPLIVPDNFLVPGDTFIISWEAFDNNAIALQRILFSPDGHYPDRFITIADNLAPDVRSYEWTIPDPGFATTNQPQFLRIVAVDDAGQEGWDQTPLQVSSGRITGNLAISTNLAGQTFTAGAPMPTITYTGSASNFPAIDAFMLFEADGHAIMAPFTSGGQGQFFGRFPMISTDAARLAIRARNNSNDVAWFFADHTFSIRHDPRLGFEPPLVELTQPQHGASLPGGTIVPITWTADATEGLYSFDIQASFSAGRTWHRIAADLPAASRSFQWQLPASGGIADVRLRIIARDRRFQNSTSGAGRIFSITPGSGPGPCYANCDQSVIPPILNVDDFTCFINEFAQAQSLPHEQQLTHYANCDNSTIAPVLNVDDFTCFINAFAQGCP